MKRHLLVTLQFVLFLGMASPAAAQEEPFSGEQFQVYKVILALFDGMRTGDSALVHRQFRSDVEMTSSFTSKGQEVIKTERLGPFLEAIGKPHDEVWDERIRNTVIQVDGNLASVWTEYGFFVGEQFSHCGVDVFTLVKENGHWKIIHLADTRRRKGCDWE